MNSQIVSEFNLINNEFTNDNISNGKNGHFLWFLFFSSSTYSIGILSLIESESERAGNYLLGY